MSPKFRKHCIPNIPKIDPCIPYPFKYLQKYPVFGQYPCIPKNPSRASIIMQHNNCTQLQPAAHPIRRTNALTSNHPIHQCAHEVDNYADSAVSASYQYWCHTCPDGKVRKYNSLKK